MARKIPPPVLQARSSDTKRLAEIEIVAFEADKTNTIWPLLYPPHQQGPLPDRIDARSQSMQTAMSKEGHIFVHVVINGVIAGFAEWVPPGLDVLDCTSDLDTSDGVSFADRFKGRVAATRKEVLGDSQYWYLAMLAVHPDFRGQGAGSALIKWGIDQAQQDPSVPLPAFLEASLMAERLYCESGFQTLGWDKLLDSDAPGGVCEWPYMCTVPHTIRNVIKAS